VLTSAFFFWGLVRHIAQPPNFFRDMKIIKMIIIMRPVRRACIRTHFSLVGGSAHDWVFAQLAIATAVAVILVVVVVRTFAVVIVVVIAHAALIPWICMALSIQMLGVWPMHMTGLLGGAFGRSLSVASAILVIRHALVGMISIILIASEDVVMIALPAAARLFSDICLSLS
jgi:hypothetical protein